MTTSKAKLSSEVITNTTDAPAAAAPVQFQPKSVVLHGPGITVLQEVTVLARMGWTVDANIAPQIFAAAGTIQVVMHPGTPEPHYFNAAATTLTEEAQREQGRWERDVANEARRQIAAAAKKAADDARAKLVAEQQEALAKLVAEQAAAVAAEQATQ